MVDVLTIVALLTAVGVTAASIVFAVRRQRELIESEARFRATVESAPVLIWMSGPDRGRTFFSAGWLALTGRRMEDELGDGWMHGVHPEDLPLYLQTSLTAMDARSRFTTEYRLRRYDGEYRWVLDTGVPRYDAAGHLAGYVGSCIDITGRHRVEQRLHEVGGRLLTVQEEERRRVARELQDELSQQLALLASELEQLSVDYPELRGDVSQRLVALSKRATTISGDAYRLSHQLHPSKLEALGLVASLRSYCREVSEQQKIHVSFTHADVPASIPMDISLCIYRIVQEALRNVARHSGADEAHVQLLSGRGGVCLRIADGGAGFDPGVNGDAGLGLISIRERLRFVGGELHIDSGRNRGTRLDVWIPLAAAGHAAAS